MVAGGFLGFLGLFLSAFVPQMEFWILTYGVLSGFQFPSFAQSMIIVTIESNRPLQHVLGLNTAWCVSGRSWYLNSEHG
jgi:hypothetical protein